MPKLRFPKQEIHILFMRCAVVIPLYNHSRYIAAALESVLSQTRKPDRILVVDDGSTDNGAEVVRGFADRGVELVVQENAGAHSTLNRAVGMVENADTVAILNSDDTFEPQRLELTLAFLEKENRRDVVVTGLQLMDPDGQPLPPEHPKRRWSELVWTQASDDLAGWLGVANFAKTTSNIVARRDYLLMHPFRDYRFVHDWFFLIQSAIENRLGVIPGFLLRYRTHPHNTIKTSGEDAVRAEVIRMACDLIAALSPLLDASADARRAYTSHLRNLMANDSDFRAEVFLAVLAQHAPRGVELDVAQFPELSEPASKELKQRAAAKSENAQLAETLETFTHSRWTKLGRKFGFLPREK